MFFSVDRIIEDRYIHESHYLLYKVMLKNSDKSYFLTDKTKIVERLDVTLCDFSALSGVISDFEFSKGTEKKYPNVEFIYAKE